MKSFWLKGNYLTYLYNFLIILPYAYRCRKKLMKAKEGLVDAENQFMEAEEELRRSEAEVREEISKLDPESQRMLRAMLKKLNEKDKSFRDDER